MVDWLQYKQALRRSLYMVIPNPQVLYVVSEGLVLKTRIAYIQGIKKDKINIIR